MNTIILIVMALTAATVSFGQIQVLWDVPLLDSSSVENVKHKMMLMPDGQVFVWAGDEKVPPFPQATLSVYDTTGALQWTTRYPSLIGTVEYIDSRLINGDILIATETCIGDFVECENVLGLVRYSPASNVFSDDLYAHPQADCRFAVVGSEQSYFAYLTPQFSLAPHGMVTAQSNNGDSLWTVEVLPYTMDNVNSFMSIRETSTHGIAVTGTFGLPGQGRNILALLDANGNITLDSVMGSCDTSTIYDAFETADHDLWIIGAPQTDVGTDLFIRQLGGDDVYIPFMLFQPTKFLPLQSGGLLIAGWHVQQVFLSRIGTARQLLWTDTLSFASYTAMLDVIEHPDGGYLALMESGTPGDYHYHLVRLMESPEVANPLVLHPLSFTLSCYPNPFNPSTQISFTLPHAGFVSLNVYNLLGQKVATLANGNMTQGRHSRIFDAQGLPSGIYLCRMESNGFSEQQKMMLIR